TSLARSGVVLRLLVLLPGLRYLLDGGNIMATIEVDEYTKRTVLFAARMANLTEGGIIRRLIMAEIQPVERSPRSTDHGVAVYADYEGHRIRARYFEPARVEIIDGPLSGKSFKTPTGAARAVVRHYNPSVND